MRFNISSKKNPDYICSNILRQDARESTFVFYFLYLGTRLPNVGILSPQRTSKRQQVFLFKRVSPLSLNRTLNSLCLQKTPVVMRDINSPRETTHSKNRSLFSLCVLSGQHVGLLRCRRVTYTHTNMHANIRNPFGVLHLIHKEKVRVKRLKNFYYFFLNQLALQRQKHTLLIIMLLC